MRMATSMKTIKRKLLIKNIALNIMILIFGIYLGEAIILLHNKAQEISYFEGDL